MPISPPNGKLRWRESDIIRFIETQSTPPANTPSVPSPTKQGKDKKPRLEAARAALERHRHPHPFNKSKENSNND